MAPRPRLPILVLERFIRRSVAHCLANPPSIPTVDDCQPDADDGARAPTANPEQTSDPFETLAGETPPLQRDPLERQSFSPANAQSSATPEIRSLHLYTIPEDGIAAANWVRIR